MHAATLRYKLRIKLAISLSHRKSGWPVLALTLQCQAPGRVVRRYWYFKWPLWLSWAKWDLILWSPNLQRNALPLSHWGFVNPENQTVNSVCRVAVEGSLESLHHQFPYCSSLSLCVRVLDGQNCTFSWKLCLIYGLFAFPALCVFLCWLVCSVCCFFSVNFFILLFVILVLCWAFQFAIAFVYTKSKLLYVLVRSRYEI